MNKDVLDDLFVNNRNLLVKMANLVLEFTPSLKRISFTFKFIPRPEKIRFKFFNSSEYA